MIAIKPLYLALASIALSVMAQFALKSGVATALDRLVGTADALHYALALLRSPLVWLGFLLYGGGAVVWLGVLARWDVSKAYPLVGLGFVLTALVGLMLGEALSVLRALGILLIAAGVWMVAHS